MSMYETTVHQFHTLSSPGRREGGREGVHEGGRVDGRITCAKPAYSLLTLM